MKSTLSLCLLLFLDRCKKVTTFQIERPEHKIAFVPAHKTALLSPTVLHAQKDLEQHDWLQDPSYPKEEFIRAVECTQGYGLCNDTELLELADHLENDSQGCYFDSHDQKLSAVQCEKELDDRLAVAHLLRQQAELQQLEKEFEENRENNIFVAGLMAEEMKPDDEPRETIDEALSHELDPVDWFDHY